MEGFVDHFLRVNNKLLFFVIKFMYTNLLNSLTPGSETEQILLCLMPDDFTRHLGHPAWGA